MNGVEPQRVNVKILEPIKGIAYKQVTHFIAVGTIEIQGCSPWRLVMLGEIGSVLAQIVALRSKVVVNDVQSNGQPARMRLVHEALQILRLAVAVLNRKRIRAVITPVPCSGELGDRHNFDGGHTERSELIQLRAHCIESSFACESADV